MNGLLFYNRHITFLRFIRREQIGKLIKIIFVKYAILLVFKTPQQCNNKLCFFIVAVIFYARFYIRIF